MKTITIDTIIQDSGIPFGEVISAHMSGREEAEKGRSWWYVAYHNDCPKYPENTRRKFI